MAMFRIPPEIKERKGGFVLNWEDWLSMRFRFGLVEGGGLR
jgi:hypothetical protein